PALERRTVRVRAFPDMSYSSMIFGTRKKSPLRSGAFFFSSRRRHTRWPRDWSSDVCSSDLVWLHVPCALWGVAIEYAGWICPLTPLENALRARAGLEGYRGGFVEHYVIPALYPAGLARPTQVVLGTLVLVVNLVAYGV